MKINEYGRNCFVFALKQMLRDVRTGKIPVGYSDTCIDIRIKWKDEAQSMKKVNHN